MAPLPSPFRIADLAVDAVRRAHQAAAGFGADRNGVEPPAVEVPEREAVASFKSERHLQLDGVTPTFWEPLSGNYPTADGWIRLHCNFEHHAVAVAKVLGVPPEKEAVTAAVRIWPATELEEEATAAGACVAALRTRDEWLAHPQSAGVAAQSLIASTIVGAGADPAPPAHQAAGPLAGIRVLDLTRIIAGPVAGRVLASYGASVLSVRARHLPTITALDIDTGFGKRSCYLDLRSAEERAQFLALVAESDIVLQSYRPGALVKLGLSPEELAEVRPGLVYVSIDAYGTTGPWASRRGFDSLLQMVTGIAAEGRAATTSDAPVALPAQALDHATGWYAAAGAIAALRGRADGAHHVHLSLARAAHELDELGRLSDAELATAVDQTPADIADLLAGVAAPTGCVRYVIPPGKIGGVRPAYACPPPIPGTSSAVWSR